jgi:hypothetical protein
MAFKSHAQAAYLKHKEPSVYDRWIRKYGKPKGVPRKVKKKRVTS